LDFATAAVAAAGAAIAELVAARFGSMLQVVAVEATEFGPARRLRPPIIVGVAPMHWDRSAVRLGSSPPTWQ
jgi:hypothetical protein